MSTGSPPPAPERGERPSTESADAARASGGATADGAERSAAEAPEAVGALHRATVDEGDPARRVRRLARLLDSAVRIPGTDLRLGLDALLGLVPGGGDVAGALLSAWIVLTAARLGAPVPVLMRMTGNLVLDALLGTVPVVGDLVDVTWKANLRNVALLERHVESPVRTRRRSALALGAVAGGLLAVLGSVAWVLWVVVRGMVGMVL